MADLLHRIQLRQLVPQLPADEGEEAPALAELARRMEPQDVQLYYQFATRGRDELNLAPDARTGFEMVLLRMLAFAPSSGGRGAMPRPAASVARTTATPRRSTGARPLRAAAPRGRSRRPPAAASRYRSRPPQAGATAGRVRRSPCARMACRTGSS